MTIASQGLSPGLGRWAAEERGVRQGDAEEEIMNSKERVCLALSQSACELSLFLLPLPCACSRFSIRGEQ